MKKYAYLIRCAMLLLVSSPAAYAQQRSPEPGEAPPASEVPAEQAYHVMPALFEEREVTLGKGERALPGTLAFPAGKCPVPAVVLVHDMDLRNGNHTTGVNKPFRDLAWKLASRGIAVLRYEKRTHQDAKKLFADKKGFTVNEETIDDACAGVSLMRGTEGIDPDRIYLLGYGFGGALAPRIAKRDPRIAGLIIMAGMSRPLEDVLYEQCSLHFSRNGELSESEKEQLDLFRKEAERVKSPNLSVETPASQLPLELPPHYWLDLRDYNPAQLARELNRPMLIIQGGRDYQVTEDDFKGWEKALSSQGNVKLILYPELNHLFVSGERKSTPKEYWALRPIDIKVIEDIARWIKDQGKTGSPSKQAASEG